MSKYTDPQNPIWFKIARWIVTSMTVIIFLVFLAITFDLEYGIGPDINDDFAILWFFLAIIGAPVHHVIGMLSLSLLYNVQQIKDNTKKM